MKDVSCVSKLNVSLLFILALNSTEQQTALNWRGLAVLFNKTGVEIRSGGTLHVLDCMYCAVPRQPLRSFIPLKGKQHLFLVNQWEKLINV